jgi:hypothetical protein
MASQFSTHFSENGFARGASQIGKSAGNAELVGQAGQVGRQGQSEQPIVLLAFAKLVLIGGALILFMPFWLDVMRALVDGSWVALRLVAVGGGAGIVVLGALFVKVWADLLKHLARAD